MPEPIDTDGDGLGDYWEDRNGNGVFDTGESNPLDFDTDYDGRTDGQEYANGTDATSASSVSSVLLGYWRFNTNSWIGEQGQLPKAFTNLQSVASWSSNAVLINKALWPSPSLLQAIQQVETKHLQETCQKLSRSSTARVCLRCQLSSKPSCSTPNPLGCTPSYSQMSARSTLHLLALSRCNCRTREHFAEIATETVSLGP